MTAGARPVMVRRVRQTLDFKRHVLLALTLLAFSLLFVASAEASTVSLLGKVEGDANSRVTMKVVKVRGTPRKVKRIEFKRLDHRCSGGASRELNVRLSQAPILKVGITSRYTFFEGISPRSGLSPPNHLNQVFVSGKLRRGAGVVTGTVSSTVRFPPVPPAIANACLSESRNYTVRRIAR